MSTVNLSLHIVGPTWAWWMLTGAASLWALAYAVRVGAEIYLRHLQRKAVAATVAAHQGSGGAIAGGSAAFHHTNARKDWRST